MKATPSSPRIGALVSLAGVALIILGFLLPMFTQSNPQVPGSAHGVYEWQAINLSSNLIVTALFASLAALPLLGMLIVCGTSVAALYLLHSPGHFIHSSPIVSLRRAAAGWGVGIQLLFDVLVFQLSLVGYARTDIAWGFVVVLVGFSISVIGAWIIPSPQKRERARQL